MFQKIDLQGSRPGPHVLITGGVHGDEFEPMSAVRRLSRTLDAETLAGRVTLIPVANKAAFLRGQRTGDDELDLARSFPGDANGSVTQRVASALSTLIRRVDCYIDLHSGGTTLSVWPLVGYMLHHDPNVLGIQRQVARAFGLPVIWGTDPNLEGRSLSVARDANVPAIYAEYHGSGCCDSDGVSAYVEGCLNVLASLGMLDRAVGNCPPTYVVEDDRRGSGHLQACYPAPAGGFFEPAVRLGDSVATGDTIGSITNTLGDRTVTIRSSQAGTVLVLRTFCRVRKGDSLAVILETNQI